MKFFKISILVLAVLPLAFSCNKTETEPYSLKYIHIMMNESSTATVSSMANTIGTYNVYLSASAAEFRESVTVTYKITVGNGLNEGADYELVNTNTTLTFLPGIYEMPIRIKWLANPVDAGKDNTLTIELVSNDKGYTIGLPGPDQNQKSFTITKVP